MNLPNRRGARAAAAVALAAIVVLHLAIVWRTAGRALDHDEGEHLRAAAWLHSGQRLYRDFVENHAPLLYQLMAPLAPPANGSAGAMRAYVVTARLLAGLAGTLAALCVAAVAARIAGTRVAAAGTLVPLLLVGWTSLRAFDDVRPEPYTLLLFWLGALLLVASLREGTRGALILGAGLGAIAAAAVWNPKWPAESLVMFAWFCMRARQSKRFALIAFGVAAAIPAVALLVMLQATTPRDLLFFVFRYPAAIARWYSASELATPTAPLAFCSAWLWPWFVLPAALLFALAERSRRALFPLLLLGASALEVRFLYSYPRLWPQYFAMWACCAALVYGLLAAKVAELMGDRYAIVVAGALLLVFVAHDLRFAVDGADERHWALKEELHRRLRPGDAAWVRPEEYPMAVPAGSYYWYAFADQVPFSLAYARQPQARGFLPPLRDEDLPPCRLLADPAAGHVRLIDQRAVRNLPRSAQCMRELWQRGAIRRIVGTPLWEVQRP